MSRGRNLPLFTEDADLQTATFEQCLLRGKAEPCPCLDLHRKGLLAQLDVFCLGSFLCSFTLRKEGRELDLAVHLGLTRFSLCVWRRLRVLLPRSLVNTPSATELYTQECCHHGNECLPQVYLLKLGHQFDYVGSWGSWKLILG